MSLLDFGAGSGDLCMVLSQAGFKVSYTDINKLLIDFAKWRFKRQNLDIKVLDNQSLKGQRFDSLLSFDVFEHLKDLPGKLKTISSFIRKGGSLIFNIELSGEGLHLEENKVYQDSKKLNKALNDAGLSFAWKFKQFYFYRKR